MGPKDGTGMKPKTATTLHIVAAVVGGLMSAINLSEWVMVGVLKRTAGYPFGGEGPVPYFYKTPELYSMVSCVFGILFLSLTATIVWAVYKKMDKVIQFASWCLLVIMIVSFINDKIAR